MISIIIPVYNAEKYLANCIDSILCQRIPEYEILLINDGSTDNSSQLCDEYANSYNTVRVIHKKNEGVSIARNVGITEARGEYIMFIDSDDTLDANWFKVVLPSINRDVDILGWGYNRIELESVRKVVPIASFYNNIDTFINSSDYSHMVWAYLFKSTIIRNHSVLFPCGIKYSEDQYFLIVYLSYCRNVRLIQQPLYNYVQHDGSAVSNGRYLSKYAYNLFVAQMLSASSNKIQRNCSLYMLDYYLRYAWKSLDFEEELFFESYKAAIETIKRNGVKIGYLTYRKVISIKPEIYGNTAYIFNKMMRQIQKFKSYKQSLSLRKKIE